MIHLPPKNYDITPLVIEVPANASFWRISGVEYATSLFFGRTGNFRWDAPDKSYGVLYLAESIECAFAETFGHNITETHRPGDAKLIGSQELLERKIYQVTTARALRLADLSGTGLAYLNLDNQINTVTDYTAPQEWSRWVRHHTELPFEGIFYRSRAMPDTSAVALFEREAVPLTEADQGIALAWCNPRNGEDMLDIAIKQGWTPVFE